MNRDVRMSITLGIAFIVIALFALAMTASSSDDAHTQLEILGKNIPVDERTPQRMWLPYAIEIFFLLCGGFLVFVGMKKNSE